MGKEGFKDLEVWRIAKNLAVRIYQMSEEGKFREAQGLKDQIRRSAVSIASNIAEGDERDSDRESIRFFYISKGSLAELRTQLQIAYEIGYIKEELFKDVDGKYDGLGKMLGSLIRARKKSIGL